MEPDVLEPETETQCKQDTVTELDAENVEIKLGHGYLLAGLLNISHYDTVKLSEL